MTQVTTLQSLTFSQRQALKTWATYHGMNAYNAGTALGLWKYFNVPAMTSFQPDASVPPKSGNGWTQLGTLPNDTNTCTCTKCKICNNSFAVIMSQISGFASQKADEISFSSFSIADHPDADFVALGTNFWYTKDFNSAPCLCTYENKHLSLCLRRFLSNRDCSCSQMGDKYCLIHSTRALLFAMGVWAFFEILTGVGHVYSASISKKTHSLMTYYEKWAVAQASSGYGKSSSHCDPYTDKNWLKCNCVACQDFRNFVDFESQKILVQMFAGVYSQPKDTFLFTLPYNVKKPQEPQTPFFDGTILSGKIVASQIEPNSVVPPKPVLQSGLAVTHAVSKGDQVVIVAKKGGSLHIPEGCEIVIVRAKKNKKK